MPQLSSTAICFLVRTGSRHENTRQHGLSHFLEHMCFKGTHKRNWQQINVRFDDLGSIYNAFTGKEHTVYYGWVPSERFEPQLELLADMLRPSLPREDFETERKVILEEIAMSGDSFEHHVWNFLHETVFTQGPLAHEILGEKETIERVPRDEMVSYHASRYAPDNVVLLAAGGTPPEEVFAAAGRYCGSWTGMHAPVDSRAGNLALAPQRKRQKLAQFKQQSVILLYPSVAAKHPAAEAIEAFTGLFGGHNSRCYWNVVQKGICSQAGAAWLSYEDCGIMALYADGEPEKCEQMLAALRAQARDVSEHGFRADEILRIKNQRRTHLALESESPRTRLMQLIDDLETHGAPRTGEARLAEVEAVSGADLSSYLNRYPITGDGLLLSAGPREWP
jgi:predicted Zn-dependent peptidase